MKKIAILIIILMLVSVGFLSGCTEQQEKALEEEPLDTDGDGVPDHLDDFPLDSNLHKKEKFNQHLPTSSSITLDTSQGSGWGSLPEITSDWKYIIVNWEITSPTLLSSEQMKYVRLGVDNPTTQGREYFSYDGYNNRSMRWVIDDYNWGYWRIGFDNIMFTMEDPVEVTIHFEIYKAR
jgi:hypothetical protein